MPRDDHAVRSRVSLTASAAAALLLAIGGQAAHARDRIGVLIASDEDQRLGDNLTEVAIAEAASAGDELVGAQELRAKLAELDGTGDLATCARDVACIVAAARAVGATRVLVGVVRPASTGSRLRMVLVDASVGKEQASLEPDATPDLPALIEAVQSCVRQLLAPPRPAVPSETARPVAVRAAQPSPLLESTATVETRGALDRGRTRSVVAYSAAGLALVSFATAIVTGVIGGGDLTGSTRVAAQEDLERRKGYARVANGCWLAGGALSIVSGMAFVWRW